MTSASVVPDSDELESDLTRTETSTRLSPDERGDIDAPESSADTGAEPPAEPVAELPSVRIPDRADAPVSEVTERFFKAIVAKVPVDRIEELHLFAPLRSGGVETGIAVIAARVLEPAPPEAAASVTLHESHVPAADESPDGGANESADESPYAPETLHEIVVDAALQSLVVVAETAAVVERHTVYTARYRLVQKGAERGKWEATVVDEADAPLITVEMVVRGVQRRAGEASETTRYSGAQVARALRLPAAP